jgi:hypothetical protein
VVAVIEVALTTVTPVAAVPPKVTEVAPIKSVPVIVTAVPPAIGPVGGATLVTVGSATYVYLFVPLVLVPLDVVMTTTSTSPAAWSGVVAVIEVALTTVTPVAAVPPKVTEVAPIKSVPVIVTAVPPAIGPVGGATLVTVGSATYVNLFVPLVLVPLGVVTITSTSPAAWAGVIAVIDVPLTTVTPVAAAPPKVTEVAPIKSVPVIVTAVLPAIGPVGGATLVTVGRATYVYLFVPVVLVPFSVVTTTLTSPAAWAGVIAVIDVPLTTVTPVAAAPPKVTEVAPIKSVPVIVTAVPPAIGPVGGVTLVTVGSATYVNLFVPVVLVPLGVVTTTLTAPAAWAGVVAVIEVALTTVTPVAAVPPKVTEVAPIKSVPVIVTAVPPAIGPVGGATLVTVGSATYVYLFVPVVLVPFGVVTITSKVPTA